MTIHLTLANVLAGMGIFIFGGICAVVAYDAICLWLFARGMKGPRRRKERKQ